MKNSINDVLEFVKEEDVKFIRLAFCDVNGKLHNASIMPSELENAFNSGVSFDASAVGFKDVEKSDLFLFPDPDTLTLLPWRPSHGRVIRLFCDIKYPDGTPFELDSRKILKNAIESAKKEGICCNIGVEFEFYLFKLDENGEKTFIPCDNASYMSVAPDDKGENIRREICLNIEEMGLSPECSHHEEGPGQNEIDFKYSDALSSADHAVIFKNATEIIANKYGFWATFAPKPLQNESGSGMHMNISLSQDDDAFDYFIGGVISKIKDITYFLNTTEMSYERLGEKKAPNVIGVGDSNRSTLIRIPASKSGKRFELRSPDGESNIYLAYALVIYAGLEGIKNKIKPPEKITENVYTSNKKYDTLPKTLNEAKEIAKNSEFIKRYIDGKFIKE